MKLQWLVKQEELGALEGFLRKLMLKTCPRTLIGRYTVMRVCFVCPQSENGNDTVYSLQFTGRKTDCLAENDKPWTDCDYLPENKVTVQDGSDSHTWWTVTDITSQ